MKQPRHDPERKQRIETEIIVDAYGPEEQAMGWCSYLQDKLAFPFTARCVAKRLISPLRVGDEIEVTGMAPKEECEHEMFVLTPWDHGDLAVPLAQVEGEDVDEATAQAIEDWHYWVAQGYQF